MGFPGPLFNDIQMAKNCLDSAEKLKNTEIKTNNAKIKIIRRKVFVLEGVEQVV